MWSKGGERGGPSWTLPGDQIVWCWAQVPEIRSESWQCTDRHKTLPVPLTAAVAMANPNNIPQLLVPQLSTLSQPSSVGRRRWELLTGGNLETAEAERGPSRQMSPEAVQTSCLRAARLCFPEFFTWLLRGNRSYTGEETGYNPNLGKWLAPFNFSSPTVSKTDRVGQWGGAEYTFWI